LTVISLISYTLNIEMISLISKERITMDNKTFNDYMIQWAAERMVAQGYAQNVDEAKSWLESRKAVPAFTPSNRSFSELGAVHTLERLCGHAYEIITHRRSGIEVEFPRRVKTYYTPHFENLVEGRAFYAPVEAM
jgi:hypothetical protein